ncbi:MAG: hypothetical protein V3U23_01160, partial [Kiloniellales bacterium]
MHAPPDVTISKQESISRARRNCAIGHAQQRAVAEWGEGIEHIIGGQRTNNTRFREPMQRGDPADDVVIPLRPHEEQVGRGQNGHR